MSTVPVVIPYEQQADLQSTRTCGAACLSMVYRSFGKEVPQADIWPAISKKNRFGSLASTTHLMAKDAVTRGLAAVTIQARHPLQVLRLCREGGFRAILNHRLKSDSDAGHYSVVADLDGLGVALHDPFFGPSRRLTFAELLSLWRPLSANSEIVGYALIVIAAEPPPPDPCVFCHTPMPVAVTCPTCGKPVGLQPGMVLGCMNNDCIARMWNYVCCPSCDYTWTFAVRPEDAPAAAAAPDAPLAAPPAAAKSTLDIDGIFSEMDKFCALLMSLPVAAARPEIQTHVDFMMASKEKLRLAVAEDAANRTLRQEQYGKVTEEARQREDAVKKKKEEINKPLPPLDGTALRQALLKNLGFTG